MDDHETEESMPDGRTWSNDSDKEERDFFESRPAPSETTKEPQDDLTPETVPRSQYKSVLDRLGTLERRMQKVDKSIDWSSDDTDDSDDDSDDDQPPGAGGIRGPWIGGTMLRDIRFIIRSARNSRKNWKEQTKQRNIALQRDRDAMELREKLIGGGESLNAAQLLFRGSKARPTYLDWTSFRKAQTLEPNRLLQPIDVLIEEPNVFQNSAYEKEIDIQLEADSEHTSRDSISKYFPERIRIHSWLLRQVLNDVSEEYVGWQADGLMLLRPFKCLVHYEPNLRAVSERLRKSINAKAEANPLISIPSANSSRQGEDQEKSAEEHTTELPSSGEPLGPEVVTEGNKKDDESGRQSDSKGDNQKAILEDSATLLHLDCLLDFYDTNIQPRLDAIANNDDLKISFDDLWNLFRPGDIVLEQGEKQAYRLIQVMTPQHRATPPWARWVQDDSSDSDDESDDNPLQLECVFLDFDGVQFGPVSKSFKIPRYEGRKSIRSFPVYGLRFSTNPDTRQQLVARGRVLLDVATYRSMYYTGLALDSKEEIDSQVVVDFSEALAVSENKAWMPQISPVLTGKKNKPRGLCYAECCRYSYIHNDEEVDQKRTAAFIQTLLPQQALDRPPLTIHPKSWISMKKEEYTPNDDELTIMTHRVFAFVLRSRKWGKSWMILRQNHDTGRY